MSTSKARIQVSIKNPKVENFLRNIAAQQNISLSEQASRLIEAGMESLEDQYFNDLAESRDTDTAEFIIHENAWK